MNSPEVFYLHISGTQRGPYTMPQIDHLLNSGLIAQETMYWREGLEQWAPVTELVVVRQEPNRWKKPLWIIGILLVLAIPARIFAPVVVTGWREANQHVYTERAAYWRARDITRNQAVPKGTLVDFGRFSRAKVDLLPPDRAHVILRGELTPSRGASREATWEVLMQFDPQSRDWAGVGVAEVAAAP